MTDLATPTTADKLRYLRKQKRLTQHAAAAQMGVSPRTYISYECNGRIPGAAELRQTIADFYGVDAVWLFGEDTRQPRPCKWCGKPLPVNAHSLKLYCSAACTNAAREQRRSEARQYTHCTVCGKLLGKNRHQFCSTACMRQAMGVEKEAVTRYCINCGAPLDGSGRKYCSRKCGDAYRSRKAAQEPDRERYDPASGETYGQFQLRTDPVYRQIYIRPGGKR